jgi:uncharacterized membrane protein YdbT with pleckstrin-like domain
MTPEKHRILSWRLFIATFFCAIAGIVIIIAIPNPSFAGGSETVIKVIARTGFGLVLIAYLTSLASFITGFIAWIKGKKHCGWIVVCGVIVLAPVLGWVASLLNL